MLNFLSSHTTASIVYQQTMWNEVEPAKKRKVEIEIAAETISISPFGRKLSEFGVFFSILRKFPFAFFLWWKIHEKWKKKEKSADESWERIV